MAVACPSQTINILILCAKKSGRSERELLQGIGRGRGVNRTDENPLDIDLLFNTALPVIVDEVIQWHEPSLWIETAAEGVMLTSRVDMMKISPSVWTSQGKADRTIADGLPALPDFIEVTYQLKDPKMKPRKGFFDLALVPDPRCWLKDKLGAILPPL